MSTLNTTNLKNASSGSNNIVLATDGSATIATLSSTTITGTTIQGTIKLGTAVASTSGTSIDFTSIPNWAKRVTVMFNGVSTSGTSNLQVQLGAGSVTSSGYTSQGVQTSSAPAITPTTSTTGMILSGAFSATALYSGVCQIINVTGNTWVNSGNLLSGTAGNANFFSGTIALGGTLDRVRITTVNGTDTFDAGTVNILYEG